MVCQDVLRLRRDGADYLDMRSFVVLLSRCLIMTSCGFNPLLRPLLSPLDPVASDPVMRPAIETPVPNRGVQRDGLPVKHQFPICWRQRSDDLMTASAAALMYYRCKGNRDIDSSLFEIAGNVFDKPMSEHHLLHGLSSLMSVFPSMV